eukprot:1161952-Pelagomonas_calceolata.AAC.2
MLFSEPCGPTLRIACMQAAQERPPLMSTSQVHKNTMHASEEATRWIYLPSKTSSKACCKACSCSCFGRFRPMLFAHVVITMQSSSL